MTASIPDNSTCVILAGKNRRRLKSLIAGNGSRRMHESRQAELSVGNRGNEVPCFILGSLQQLVKLEEHDR